MCEKYNTGDPHGYDRIELPWHTAKRVAVEFPHNDRPSDYVTLVLWDLVTLINAQSPETKRYLGRQCGFTLNEDQVPVDEPIAADGATEEEELENLSDIDMVRLMVFAARKALGVSNADAIEFATEVGDEYEEHLVDEVLP